MANAMKKGTKKRRLNKDDEKGPENKTSVEETPSFASFRLDSRLLKAISKQFEKPTLVQAAAIPLALNGRDIVARAKTGSGKTLAYVIPIINQILTKTVRYTFVAPANYTERRQEMSFCIGPCSHQRARRTSCSDLESNDDILRQISQSSQHCIWLRTSSKVHRSPPSFG